ncbi:SDR family NAD(P)-dependent oxidoreductase [Lichenicoccus roseus]|uniref:SDR family NAD(P)-dependent oxidoreductase n=2 Tax=Lichenicoccus roseus TaxID=2683649 RepID=A0A5R9J7L0_9PROT|nr:oxidoreductase [Lichenicoccus roseus]TLU71611.1 SDR family NAD(P)-dependent oxidoreductase [Lichenicoccus roseus]
MRDGWSLGDAPSLDGRVAIVTGATGGIGYETALGLARRGATTILASRNQAKGDSAVARIRRALPKADARFEALDLNSLASVARFADRIQAAHPAIAILVNNAGVMGFPQRLLTEDGFERQIGVNYLAHFALTARLSHALQQAEGGGRVVEVASLAHRRATLDLGDLQSERDYNPFRAYGQSKLAMLVFAIELERRSLQHGWKLCSVAAHPGWSRTDIVFNGPGQGAPGLKEKVMAFGFNALAQSARDGALPSLFAAMAAEAKGGGYYGPTLLAETRGPVGPSVIMPQAADPATASRLWTLSEQLTGVSFGQSSEAG